jgi:erythromycin esterase-like protein
VWAHNSHVGDARYTDTGMSRGELNVVNYVDDDGERRCP